MRVMFPVMFSGVFIIVISMFVIIFVKSISTWSKNNNSPKLIVDAVVVCRRCRSSGTDNVSTTYYVTFQVESGDRMEFHVSGREFGMMAEGDYGRLTFQGTRFLRFERQK